MTAPAIPSPIWLVVTDFGPRIGTGSGDYLISLSEAVTEYIERLDKEGLQSRVIEIDLTAGTSRDCTADFAAIAALRVRHWAEAAE